jgi:hypothetical protein
MIYCVTMHHMGGPSSSARLGMTTRRSTSNRIDNHSMKDAMIECEGLTKRLCHSESRRGGKESLIVKIV